MRALLAASLLAAACDGDPAKPRRPAHPDLQPPAIEEVELVCDPDRSKWGLRIEASAWTGGATTHWTEDGVYVEKHRVPSVELAADGSHDTLEFTLNIEADWREVKPNASTAFPCTAAPNVVVWVADVDGDDVACWSRGPDRQIWKLVQGVAPCPAPDPA